VSDSPRRLISLIRHGQYEPTSTGGTLTGLGRRQARAVARRLAADPTDALICSPLGRALETAEIISGICEVELATPRDYLRESWPTGVPGHKVPRAARSLGKARVAALLHRHVKPSKADRHEVLVGHGNLIRATVSAALEVPMTRWIRMYIHHASVTRIAVFEDGRVALWCYNDTGHLKPELTTMTNADPEARTDGARE
jgi:broad specificity phosphatase PhoE